MGRCKGSKNKQNKGWTRQSWLAYHPEDIPLDRENQAARLRGWENDDARRLFAAIALQTCIDYKNACRTDTRYSEEYQEDERNDCIKAFGEEHFKYFLGDVEPEKIKRILDSRSLEEIRQKMYVINFPSEAASEHSRQARQKAKLAKNTTAIIEE